MTVFNVSMLLTADADQARRELKGAEAEVIKFGAAARQAGNTAAAGFDRAEAEILQFKRASSGATSSLVAQFNDVGQMLIAGQSPLLLAAQQGTQISQALGPLGARGAVQALGSAFLGMLSPVNLAVFAAVAGLGLLGNALRDVIGDTRTVEEAIGDLETATKEWRDAAKVGSDDLMKEFGRITPELIEMQQRLTELKLVEVLLNAAGAAKVLSDQFADGRFLPFSGQEAKVADLLNTKALAPGSISRLAPDVAEFVGLLKELETSDSLDVQADALARMQELVRASSGGLKNMTAEQATFLNGAVALERQLRLALAAEEGMGSAQQVANARALEQLTTLREQAGIRDLIRQHGEESLQVEVARVEAERRVFEQMVATLDVSDLMKRQLLEAWDAANGAQASAGELFSALLDAAGAGDDTKRALEDAWSAISGAAGETNVWAGMMAGVAAEVRGIASALGSIGKVGIANAGKQIELDALRAGQSVADARRTAQEAEARREATNNEAVMGHILAQAKLKSDLAGIDLDRQLDNERRVASERERSARGGSGRGSAGRSSSRQTDAGQRLITSLERENELLRETDPIQKEIIRNREALAKLMGEERTKAEELIETNYRLREQQEQEKQSWEDVKQAAFDALDGLILRGESAADVMANLADWIGKALLQSALLGTGPLAGIFGGQGTGLFDIFGGALGIPGAATGGYIAGPGGPRDDKVLARLSNGEFVVNAAATARHRPLLEAINSAPGYASGGFVGASGGAGQAGAGGPLVIELRLTDDVDARIAETSEQVSVRVMRGGLQEYDAKVLPRRMKAISADPRRVG